MRMLQIFVVDRSDLFCRNINYNKWRRRPEMVEYRAIDALIILGGKTYLHIQTSIFLFCAYAQCIKRSIQLSSGTLDNPALLKYGVEVVD